MDQLVSIPVQGAPPPPAMTAAEVAGALQITIGTFYAKREALEAAGFPKKMPGVARWPRALVHEWIASGGAS